MGGVEVIMAEIAGARLKKEWDYRFQVVYQHSESRRAATGRNCMYKL